MIQHPGLKCHIQVLDGVLSYTHLRKDKPPYSYQIKDSDLDDEEPDSEVLASQRGSGIQDNAATISAVGLLITILKNDGVMKIKFLGKLGAEWSWRVQGLDIKVVRGGMGVQTVHTGNTIEGIGKAKQMTTSQTQTQLSILAKTSESELRRLFERMTWQKQEKSLSGQTIRSQDECLFQEAAPGQSKKRRRTSPATRFSPSLFLKHLYMACLRWPPPRYHTNPRGTLHINVEEAKAWYKPRHPNGCDEMPWTSIHLHHPTTIIEYQHLDEHLVIDDHEYDATITILPSAAPQSDKLILHVSSSQKVKGTEASGQAIEFSTHHIIFNALRDCVDRASGRRRPECFDYLTRNTVASTFCVEPHQLI